jgi:protein-S-isoprenylcysteine O-methyltransferase Ste14
MSRLNLPPVWLLLFAILAWTQGKYLHIGPISGSLTDFLGGLLVGGGILLMLVAAAQFRKARTTIHPHNQPDALITGGIYKRTRNPIYIGDLMIFAGLCLYWEAWPSLLLVAVLWWIFDRHFVRPEEARLRATFGHQFLKYAARTPRWIRRENAKDDVTRPQR